MKGLLRRLEQLYLRPQNTLKLFLLGALLFGVGGGLFLYARDLPPSLDQELWLLAALGLGGPGFVLAISAHLGLIVQRLWREAEPPAAPKATAQRFDRGRR